MTEEQVTAYVRASAALHGLPLDAVRAKAVAEHLMRTSHLAQLLDAAPLAEHDELAEIYRPAAFPLEDTVCSKP
jgi:Protein of unknown function (DUF4089)